MHIINGKSETIVYLGDQSRLDISDKLKKEVDSILGEGTTTYC
jgi:DNA polymerase-3 subunit alpha